MKTRKKLAFALLALVLFVLSFEGLFWAFGWPSLPEVNASDFEHSSVYWRDEPNQVDKSRTHGERRFRLPQGSETPFCEGEEERYNSLTQRYESFFLVNSDASGLRAPFHSIEKPEGAFRILLLGCSTTFGWGVADEETLPAQLESILRARGHHQVEIINGGQPGYTSFQGKRFYEEVASKYNADFVFLGYVIQDSRKVAYSDLSQAILQDRAQFLKQGFFYRSRLYQAIKLALGSIVVESQSCMDDFGRETDRCYYRVGEEDFLANYRSIRAMAEADGARVGHFAFPEEVAIGHSRQHRFLQAKEAEHQGIPFFDASLQIEQETRSFKPYYGWQAPRRPTLDVDSERDCVVLNEDIERVDPGHANAAGLRRIAELFAGFLEAEGLLK